MDFPVFLAVLAAAAMHAGWNVIVKGRAEPLTVMVAVQVLASLLALALLPFFGLPAPASWPYLATTTVIHIFYFLWLVAAYDRADMGLVYPVARGSAPLMTGLVSVLVVGERVPPLALAGILLLGGGIMALAFESRSAGRDQRTGLVFAALTAVSIVCYTFADGLGGRISGNVHAYALVNFVLNGVSIAVIGLVRRGPAIFRDARPLAGPGLLGAAMTLGSYWIAIWAMTQAPIGLVAATRETSVLFATVFAVVLLGERVSRLRIVSAGVIVAGLVLMRLG